MFNGWNEPSVLGGTNTVAADDWVCTTSNPVTHIRWWGSFLNWRSNVPPTLPDFRFGFWRDVPAGVDAPNSHPGQSVRDAYAASGSCIWKFVGWDLDPRTLAYEACFRFERALATNEWFYQPNPPAGSNLYWLSIAAVYPQGVPAANVWGWKTRPRDTNSPAPDAVRFTLPQGPYQPLYWPNPTNSWDLAFGGLNLYFGVAFDHHIHRAIELAICETSVGV